MDFESLRLARGKAFTALLDKRQEGLSTVSDVAGKMSSNPAQRQKIYSRLLRYKIGKGKKRPRDMMPFETCILVAKVFGLERPSDLYLEMTTEEQARQASQPGGPKDPPVPAGEGETTEATRPQARTRTRRTAPTFKVTVTVPEFDISALKVQDAKIKKTDGGYTLQISVPVNAEAILDRLLG